jgi:hypothetical protein
MSLRERWIDGLYNFIGGLLPEPKMTEREIDAIDRLDRKELAKRVAREKADREKAEREGAANAAAARDRRPPG